MNARASLLLLVCACSSSSGPPPPSFCPRAGAILCADFDRMGDPSIGFSGVSSFGLATGVIDKEMTSPSLFVSVPETSTGMSAFAPFWETSDTLGRIRAEFSCRAEALASIVTIAMIWYPRDQYFVALELAMGNVYLIEEHAGVSDSPIPIAQVKLGEWHRYGLEARPEDRKIAATFDGVTQTFNVAAVQKFTLMGNKRVLVGIVSSNPVRPLTKARFDDIEIRIP